MPSEYSSKKRLKIPVIYISIYGSIKEKSNGKNQIDYEIVRELLHRKLYAFPKILHYAVLKEMEEINLIKKIGNTSNIRYKLVGRDIEKALNKLNYLS